MIFVDESSRIPTVTDKELDTKPIRFFRCTKCGDCCRRPGVVPLTYNEVNALVLEAHKRGKTLDLQTQIDTLTGKKIAGAYRMVIKDACPFLIDPGSHCSLEDVGKKPGHCAKYPFIPEVASGMIPWSTIEKDCEGVRPTTPDRKGYTATELVQIVYRRGVST